MCIVIDNNVAARVLVQNDPEFEPVRDRLSGKAKPAIRVAYGGKLLQELSGNLEIRPILKRLDETGQATLVPDEKIEEEQRNLVRLDVCISNDVHVVALARAARARILISLDQDLHRDFTNPKVLQNPRGKIYQRREHARLLNTPCNMANYRD